MSDVCSPFASDADWEADWDSHGRAQQTAGLAATPAQRLAWLEEMRAFAYRQGALGGRLEEPCLPSDPTSASSLRQSSPARP
jgi:hypothetical protein